MLMRLSGRRMVEGGMVYIYMLYIQSSSFPVATLGNPAQGPYITDKLKDV